MQTIKTANYAVNVFRIHHFTIKNSLFYQESITRKNKKSEEKSNAN